METTAIIRGVHISAQKTRLVADLIRGQSVAQALNFLTFTTKKAADIPKKARETAIANAEHNDGVDIHELRATPNHEIGRAPDCTPDTDAQMILRPMLGKRTTTSN